MLEKIRSFEINQLGEVGLKIVREKRLNFFNQPEGDGYWSGETYDDLLGIIQQKTCHKPPPGN